MDGLEELQRLSVDLGRQRGNVTKVAAVMGKAGQNIKRQMVSEASGSRHFRFAKSISYDVLAGGLSVEVGPEKGGAGSLAHIAYFGGANGGGGTVPDPMGALQSEAESIGKLLLEGVFDL